MLEHTADEPPQRPHSNPAPMVGHALRGASITAKRLPTHGQGKTHHSLLTRAVRALQPTLVALEATGGYERASLVALALAGVSTALVNPRQVRHSAKAIGRPAKTDRVDAQAIAQYAEAVKPKQFILCEAH